MASGGIGRGRGGIGRGTLQQSQDVKPKMRFGYCPQMLDEYLKIGGSSFDISISEGVTKGLGLGIKKIKVEPDEDVKPDISKLNNGVEYVKEVVERERIEAMKYQEEQGHNLCTENMDQEDLDGVSTTLNDHDNVVDADMQRILDIHFDPTKRTLTQKLPIADYKEKIVQAVKVNPVIIIEGSTGCGKTTQVPQYIADDCYKRRKYFNIVVTQPRRIAAMSVARRVCQERKWNLGELVGYQVGMDKTVNEITKILYCTTGVLLQKLIAMKRIDCFTHIIVDEVHERNAETDLLLMMIRKFMWTQPSPVRIIVMSATFDTALLQEYFAIPNPRNPQLSIKPVICSIGEKPKNVSLFYLGQLMSRTPKFEINEPSVLPEIINLAYTLVQGFDSMDSRTHGKGAVLIFVPGYEEIYDLMSKFKNDKHLWVLPLHSSITSEEQRRVFEEATRGSRKVIIATNIAESSITVPDIEYVIDFCLTKNLICDPETNYPTLRLEWASKANCNQRSGRAGRVIDGRCYRLVPSDFFDRYFNDYPTPELVRAPLELSVLKVKKLAMGPPKDLLALCLDPPNLGDIKKAVLRLKSVGALSTLINGEYNLEDGNITPMGDVMSILPIDVQLSKLILLGHAFDCMNDCIIMAACLSLRNLFSRPFGKDIDAYKAKLAWADRTFSDLMAFFNAFKHYRACISNQHFTSNSDEAKRWCVRNFVQHRRIREVEVLYDEIKNRLDQCFLRIPQRPNDQRDLAFDELILKIVMCGAFYPNYFIRMEMDTKEIKRQLSEKDPCTTVRIGNLPANQGVIYSNMIRELFAECSNQIDIEFEETHALLTFSQSRNPLEQAHRQQSFFAGRDTNDEEERKRKNRDTSVKTSVYIAVKMSRLNNNNNPNNILKLTLFKPEYARNKLEKYMKSRDSRIEQRGTLRSNRFSVPAYSNKKITQIDLPSLNTREIKIFITEVVDCGHFWAQYLDQNTREILSELKQLCGNHSGRELIRASPGMIVLSPWTNKSGRTEYYRAKIESVDDTGTEETKVFYIDFGNSEVKQSYKQLVEINDERLLKAPALAFECRLYGIKPSEFRTFDGNWHDEAKKFFVLTVSNNKELTAEVFSVVGNVVRVTLYAKDPDGRTFSINRELIAKHLAEETAETHLSLVDNQQRRIAQSSSSSRRNQSRNLLNSDCFEVNISNDEREEKGCFSNENIRIRGPTTPIEASFHGITKQNFGIKVNIERDSVNSVVLEPYPETSKNRLLVAANVGLTGQSGKVIARDTTLMPNIKGFASLMLLLFAPCCELRTDKDYYRYTGAIFGLGYDRRTKQSYDPDNDVEMPFDVTFTPTDLKKINFIRYHLSDLLSNVEAMRETTGVGLSDKQRRVRNEINALLTLKRIPQYFSLGESRSSFVNSLIPRYDFKWGCLDEDRIERPEAIFEIEPFLKLHPLVTEITAKKWIEAVTDNIEGLNLMLATHMNNEAFCLLCAVKTYTPLELSNHLHSDEHKIKVKELDPESTELEEADTNQYEYEFYDE